MYEEHSGRFVQKKFAAGIQIPDGVGFMMYTELRDWTEWQERCALGLCAEATAKRLVSYGHSRFLYYARKYLRRTALRDARTITPSPEQCWHLFETRAAIGRTREGKSYKRWIFARGETSHDNLLDVVQAGATLLFRDAVRDHLRKEAPPAQCLSLQAPLRTPDDALTWEDLLPGTPDPGDALALRELDRMAVRYADALLPETTRREQLLLLARASGVNFSSKPLARAAGCGRSAMYNALRGLLRRITGRLAADLEGEDRQTLALLTLKIVDELKKATAGKKKLDKRHGRFFIEERETV